MRPPGAVPPRPRDALLRPRERHPRRAERLLVLVQAVGRLALDRRTGARRRRRRRRGPSRSAAPRARARSRASAGGASRPGGRGGARRGRRSARSTGAARGDTGRGRRARRRRPRPRAPRGRRGGPRRAPGSTSVTNSLGPREPEPAPVAGRAQQVVEPTERRARPARSRGRGPLERPGRVRVPAHDDDPVALGAADPLPRRLRDAVHHRRPRPSGRQRRPHPMPRGLDLGDGVEARGPERRGVRRVVGRDLGIGGDDVDPRVGRGAPPARPAPRRPSPPGPVARPRRAATTGPRGTYAEPPPTIGHGRTSTSARVSPTARNRGCQPARLAMARPCPRLEDVAALDVDRRGVPAVELGALEPPDVGHVSPPPSPP